MRTREEIENQVAEIKAETASYTEDAAALLDLLLEVALDIRTLLGSEHGAGSVLGNLQDVEQEANRSARALNSIAQTLHEIQREVTP